MRGRKFMYSGLVAFLALSLAGPAFAGKGYGGGGKNMSGGAAGGSRSSMGAGMNYGGSNANPDSTGIHQRTRVQQQEKLQQQQRIRERQRIQDPSTHPEDGTPTGDRQRLRDPSLHPQTPEGTQPATPAEGAATN